MERVEDTEESMEEGTLRYHFEEKGDAGGDLVLELFIEGARASAGRVSREMLGLMRGHLGLTREAVAAGLRRVLLGHLDRHVGRVTLVDFHEHPARPLYFISRYALQELDELEMGLVWCDVTSEELAGPESVPIVVQHRMRREVLLRHIQPGTVTREIIEMHERA